MTALPPPAGVGPVDLPLYPEADRLYRLARGAIALAMRVFFRRTTVRGAENVPESGPLILAANHPSSIVDAFSIGLATPRKVHFLARSKIPPDEVAWDSGFRLLGGVLTHFANPLPVLDSFLTLLLVGLLLAGVRQRTGAIAACIGLHAGWVCVIKATKDLTVVDTQAATAFLVGPFDGYTGWLVAGWGIVLVAIAWARGWMGPRGGAAR